MPAERQQVTLVTRDQRIRPGRLRHGQEVFLARTPAEWREAVERLSSCDATWQAMSTAAFHYARATWSPERGQALMAEALHRLALPVREPAAP